MSLSVRKRAERLKPLVHLALALPLVWLGYEWAQAIAGKPHALGFLPQETSNRLTGDWALRILLIGLAVTPLARLLNRDWPLVYRRMIGLWAFVHVIVHMATFIWLDKGLRLGAIWRDIVDRPYITIGTLALLLLVPLAVTSRTASIKAMGYKAWKRLHRLVYPISVLAVVHFIIMRRGFQLEPLVYAAILCALLALRFLPKRKRGTVKGWVAGRLGGMRQVAE